MLSSCALLHTPDTAEACRAQLLRLTVQGLTLAGVEAGAVV